MIPNLLKPAHRDILHELLEVRGVWLIGIEIKSWFELARFLNGFIAWFFSCPWPQLTVKHSLFSSSVLLLHVYTRYNLFAHSSCTSLFILLCIKSSVYCFAHFTLYFLFFFVFFYLYLHIFSCVVLLFFIYFLHCPLIGTDLSTFHFWLYPV